MNLWKHRAYLVASFMSIEEPSISRTYTPEHIITDGERWRDPNTVVSHFVPVSPQFDPRAHGIKVDTLECYGKINMEEFLKWIFSLDNFNWYWLSQGRKVMSASLCLKGAAQVW